MSANEKLDQMLKKVVTTSPPHRTADGDKRSGDRMAVVNKVHGRGNQMDRAKIEEHLQQTDSHIALGEKHLERQHKIIAELQRDGHDTTAATDLLATLEETQRLHVDTRKTILEEWGSADNGEWTI
jgi:hypothetical protein